jgi:hypothetical protein
MAVPPIWHRLRSPWRILALQSISRYVLKKGRQVWVRLPYDSEGKGLRIHGVAEAVTLLGLSGHAQCADDCPLLGAKRTGD